MTRMLKELRTGFILNKARSYESFHRGVETILNMLLIEPGQLRGGSQPSSTAEAGRNITPPPKSDPTINPEPKLSVKTNLIKPAMPGSEGGNNLIAKNLEELRREDPKLAATVEAELKAAAPTACQNSIDAALAAERKRLQDIDDIAPAINDENLVHEAKYGNNPCTAQELAYRAATNKAVDQGVSATKQAYHR